jgi:hypothetical protein
VEQNVASEKSSHTRPLRRELRSLTTRIGTTYGQGRGQNNGDEAANFVCRGSAGAGFKP